MDRWIDRWMYGYRAGSEGDTSHGSQQSVGGGVEPLGVHPHHMNRNAYTRSISIHIYLGLGLLPYSPLTFLSNLPI